MSHDQFEVLSNQAVAVCAVAYFLALLCHLAEWAVARSVPAESRQSGAEERQIVAEAAQVNAGSIETLERAEIGRAHV